MMSISDGTIVAETQQEAALVLVCLMNFKKFEIRNKIFSLCELLEDRDALMSVANYSIEHLSRGNQTFAPPPPPTLMSSITSTFSSWLSWGSSLPLPLPAADANSSSNIHQQPLPVAMIYSTMLVLYEFVYHNKLFSKLMASSFAFDNSSGPMLIQNLIEICLNIVGCIEDIHKAFFTKISFIILISLLENEESTVAMHDQENGLDIVSPIDTKHHTKLSRRPIIHFVLDTVILFVKNNLKKKMQLDIYRKSLLVVQRIICHQKKHKIQIPYQWKNLWDALFMIVKFIGLPSMLANADIVSLACDVTRIFNLFVTYGDSFLSSETYDQLFYEMIHNRKMLEHFCMSSEATNNRTLVQQLQNIKTILRHFSSKLDAWQDSNPSSILSQDQVMGVIRNSYATLQLNLLAGLDEVEMYSENPREIKFFQQYCRRMLFEFKPYVTIRNFLPQLVETQ